MPDRAVTTFRWSASLLRRRCARDLRDRRTTEALVKRHQCLFAALAAWVARYDAGEWDDPPGKLSLLYDLERIRELIRGCDPFHPKRDRAAFVRFLVDAGCQSPPKSHPIS